MFTPRVLFHYKLDSHLLPLNLLDDRSVCLKSAAIFYHSSFRNHIKTTDTPIIEYTPPPSRKATASTVFIDILCWLIRSLKGHLLLFLVPLFLTLAALSFQVCCFSSDFPILHRPNKFISEERISYFPGRETEAWETLQGWGRGRSEVGKFRRDVKYIVEKEKGHIYLSTFKYYSYLSSVSLFDYKTPTVILCPSIPLIR